MKTAVILAGGLGTRLRPVTYEIPKPLIPVQGRTLTEHVLDIFKENGIKTVYLSIGYMSDKIIAYFGDGKKFGLKIKYLVEKKALGTGGWMNLVKKEDPDFSEDFIVVNGDNLFDVDFNEMFRKHKDNDAAITIALTTVDDPSQYGVAKLEGEKIVEFVEKPKKEEAPSNYINGGYYIFSPAVFRLMPNKEEFMLEKDLFPKVAKKGELYAFKSDSQWFDTGTFERWERVIKEWRKR
jgi:NDP-sugar pyrophosphorylase family protein